jgi:hypothetical protein
MAVAPDPGTVHPRKEGLRVVRVGAVEAISLLVIYADQFQVNSKLIGSEWTFRRFARRDFITDLVCHPARGDARLDSARPLREDFIGRRHSFSCAFAYAPVSSVRL